MTQFPIDALRARIDANELEADAAQLEVAAALDALARSLTDWRPKKNGIRSLFTRAAGPAPRGLYIHGDVGRGKTMLMDLFFAGTSFAPKQRSHFHEFMADVHERIAKARREVDGDPIPHVAAAIADEAALLCFDEMQVTDIADAMILGRLFKHLFERQVVMVATSNSAPEALYENGLNRQLFLPFIALIGQRMDVVELKSAKDYRLEKLAGLPLYFAPADARATAELDAHWDRLTGRHPGASEVLEVKGRQLRVPLASMGVARFDFRDLCEAPLGSIDYLRIAHAYHTLLIDGIPVVARERRDAVRRFINLIDTLYDNKVCLIASAAAEPDFLCEDEAGAKAFARTASRLMEMRSEEYLLARGERGHVGVAS
ncbi:MAG: cell division protein ZapE [Hyphomicrobium sp.]|jgi:cell division protein ZapE